MANPVNKLMTFSEAIIKVIDGQKITRVQWADNRVYGLLRNTTLQLHKPDGRSNYYTWTVNEGDLQAEDWIVVLDN